MTKSQAGEQSVQKLLIGNERTPVILIDDFSDYTEALRQEALASNFSPDGATLYPGLRAPMPREAALDILKSLYKGLYPTFQVPAGRRLKPLQASFSLVTRSPEELDALQCIPHFDTSKRHFYALLLYLNPGVHGATGFFRHRPTGFERISDERVDTYLTSAGQYNETYGAPARRYCTGTSGQYQLYTKIDYRQHRLAIYPGNLLHSVLVDPARDIDSAPETGRLTANIFFEFC